MAVDTIQLGRVGQTKNLHTLSMLNPKHPYPVAVSEIAGIILLTTDFTSGNDVDLVIKEAKAILSADVKIGDGSDPEAFTNKDFTYTPPASGTAGAKITIAAADQNLMVNIKYRNHE